MPFITENFKPRYHQMSIEDILNAPPGALPPASIGAIGDTRTYFTEKVPERLSNPTYASNCVSALVAYKEKYKALYEAERASLYTSFKIPKTSGGYRQIDAPKDPLMEALRELKTIFETVFFASHHTSAFAYVGNRCTIDAVKRHQSNKSRWFLKTDCSNFFGSTTKEFTIKMMSIIWPFSEIIAYEAGKALMEDVIDIAFLNGGLPQGTPISPLITNLVMIPIDHDLYNSLRDFDGHTFVYTRYADDMQISCRTDFTWTNVCNEIYKVFKKYDAPYVLKREKTHYGSSAGKNWILGVMYNKDGNITLGRKRKDSLKASIHDYVMCKKNGKPWDLGDVRHLDGTIAYFKKVEREYTTGLLNSLSQKYEFNIVNSIRADLRSL